jgi:hypothetical protein
MNSMYVISGILSLGLLIYLLVASQPRNLMTSMAWFKSCSISLCCWDWRNH